MNKIHALRWIVASATVVIMFTMTTVAHGSHGTHRVSDVVADAMDGLYALTWDPGVLNREVWRSTDGGDTWTPTALAHPSLIGLAIAPTLPDPTLYVYSNCTGDSNCAGLRRSTDGGATWISAGFPNARVLDVTIAPDMPTTLYARVDNAGTVGWFKSIDAGASWTDTNWPVGQLVIDQAIPPRLYGLNGWDILRLDEATNNWSIVLSLPPPPVSPYGSFLFSGMPFLVASGSTVYAVNSTYSVPYCDLDSGGPCDWFAEPATVYSSDGGSSWTWGTPGYYRVWDLAMHGSTLYAATTQPYWSWSTAKPGVIKSTDGGANWMDTALSMGSEGLAVDSNAVYAVTSEGLFKRAHDGGNWTATALAPHPQAVTSLSLLGPGPYGSFDGTVTLSAAAPAGGAIVTLSSSNPAVATVPSFLIFSAGTTAANFTVWANWATFTTVTISATGTTTAQDTITKPGTLTSLSLSPSVAGGTTSTGTVTLSSPAPSSGLTVALSSSNPAVAAVPANVVVPAGATTSGFTVSTTAVTSAQTVTISASSGGVTQSAALTVTAQPPPALVSIGVSPTSVKGGSGSTGTITLSAAAPPSGVTVTLSSSQPNLATVPSSITVLPGATSAHFTVTTSRPKPPSTDVTISAILGTVTKAATLTVRR